MLLSVRAAGTLVLGRQTCDIKKVQTKKMGRGLMPPRHKQVPPSAMQGGGGEGGTERPPQPVPVDMNHVKGVLREVERGAYGETFRGDRLAKIAMLGKGVSLFNSK